MELDAGWDDFQEGAQVCNTSQSCHGLDLSHTHACTCEECYQARNTNKTEKNVRATRCSVFTDVAYKGIAIACKSNSLIKSLRKRKNLAKWLPHKFCKESVAFTLFTTCVSLLVILPLVISKLNVLVFKPLRVLMFTLQPIL